MNVRTPTTRSSGWNIPPRNPINNLIIFIIISSFENLFILGKCKTHNDFLILKFSELTRRKCNFKLEIFKDKFLSLVSNISSFKKRFIFWIFLKRKIIILISSGMEIYWRDKLVFVNHWQRYISNGGDYVGK